MHPFNMHYKYKTLKMENENRSRNSAKFKDEVKLNFFFLFINLFMSKVLAFFFCSGNDKGFQCLKNYI